MKISLQQAIQEGYVKQDDTIQLSINPFVMVIGEIKIISELRFNLIFKSSPLFVSNLYLTHYYYDTTYCIVFDNGID